jgi:hypothetical protein
MRKWIANGERSGHIQFALGNCGKLVQHLHTDVPSLSQKLLRYRGAGIFQRN